MISFESFDLEFFFLSFELVLYQNSPVFLELEVFEGRGRTDATPEETTAVLRNEEITTSIFFSLRTNRRVTSL